MVANGRNKRVEHQTVGEKKYPWQCLNLVVPSLKQLAPESGWLEDDPFILGYGLFSGQSVSFREGKPENIET